MTLAFLILYLANIDRTLTQLSRRERLIYYWQDSSFFPAKDASASYSDCGSTYNLIVPFYIALLFSEPESVF